MERLTCADPQPDTIGALVRTYRHRVQLSQEELAEQSGLSERTIRNLEADRVRVPRPATARLLIAALGLDGPERATFVSTWRGKPARSDCDGRASEAGSVTAHDGFPAQLPMDLPVFAGRDAQLARLDHIFATSGEPPTTVVVSAISGAAGVGKTALGVHWAHLVAGRFGDGQLYVNLRGFDPTGSIMSPASALANFLDALGVPPRQIPAGLDARAALYRSVLAGRRVLVLLDDARDAEQARPLVPGSAGCLVVVTSRNPLIDLVSREGAHPLRLPRPSHAEARELLVRRLGAERIAAQPQAVGEIITRCRRMPVALAIVAARAALSPALPLSVFADELRYAGESPDALVDCDTANDAPAVCSLPPSPVFDTRGARLRDILPGRGPSASAVVSTH